jgi:hypothetical protein
MYAERHTVTIVTDGSGDGTGYTPVVTGRVISVQYVKTDYTDGVDFVVTAEATGEVIWDEDNVNASAVRAPRQATHSTAGVAALYAAGGTAVQDYVMVARDRIKIVVASGGSAKTGAFHVVLA